MLFKKCIGLKGENFITSFSGNYLWSAYLVPGAMGEAINVTKEPPAFKERAQVETGGKESQSVTPGLDEALGGLSTTAACKASFLVIKVPTTPCHRAFHPAFWVVWGGYELNGVQGCWLS